MNESNKKYLVQYFRWPGFVSVFINVGGFAKPTTSYDDVFNITGCELRESGFKLMYLWDW